MSDLSTAAKRKNIVNEAVKNNQTIGGGLNFETGTYDFSVVDENAHSIRTGKFKRGERKGNEFKIFLIKGEIKNAAGEILDRGHRAISVDVPELWAEMKKGVKYAFEIVEYEAERILSDGSAEKVMRKGAQNWRQVGA